MAQKENLTKELKNINSNNEIAVEKNENKDTAIVKADEQKVDKKELVKIAKEKSVKRKLLKEKQYSDIYEADKDLAYRRLKEEKEIKKNKKTAIILICSIVGLPFGLVKLIKGIKKSKQIQNPFELQKIIIIEEALKRHNNKNKIILETYKEEKIRIKKLKKLPFKILNHVNFLISMFLIILFFFILDIGVAPTALVLFSSFCLMYFAIGLLMHIVFYMVAENKTREKLAKLEEEKNRLLAEEKMRNEEQLRVKIEKERRFYEEKERIRFEEERLRKLEITRREREIEETRIKAEEEARIKAEEEAERIRIKEEEEQKIAELEEEKIRLTQEKRLNLLKKLESSKHKTTGQLTKAEFAQQKEAMRNEFDKNLLEEINSEFVIPNVSGIENFVDVKKLQKEYANGMVFHNEDVEKVVNNEIDNTILTSVKEKVEDVEIHDFDTTDIEEAKQQIFKNARKKIENPSATKTSVEEDLEMEQIAIEESVGMKTRKATTKPISNTTNKPSPSTEGKAISGKSFMIIKEMMKNG